MRHELQRLRDALSIDLSQLSPIGLRLSRHGGLTRLWHGLGYKVGAEIGTEEGRFAAEIFRDNPALERLYCIDPYQAYDRYEQHQTQTKLDGFYQNAQQRLAGRPVTFIRQTSLAAVDMFQPGTLDFVFIDGNHHFDYVVRDIITWAPIVRSGGMVAGHDYKPEGAERVPIPFGVIEAVNAYTAAHRIRPWFVTHGDKCPSWLWIRDD